MAEITMVNFLWKSINMLLKKLKICAIGLIGSILGAGQSFSADVVGQVFSLIQTDFVNPELSDEHVLNEFLSLVEDDASFREVVDGQDKLVRLCSRLIGQTAGGCHRNIPVTSFNLLTRVLLLQNLTLAEQNEKINYLSGVLNKAVSEECTMWNDSFSPFVISEFQFIVTSMGENYQPGSFSQILPMFEKEHMEMSSNALQNSCNAHGCINQYVYLEVLKALDEDQALTSSEKLDIANWLIKTDYSQTRETMFVGRNGKTIRNARGMNRVVPYETAQRKLIDMIGDSPAKVAFLSTIAEEVERRLG
ncbi:MAG: hypothetical protein LBQ43_02195 [Holosporales bacterium]|jgi:hypothetical protein|nr:hypothetical protein [Holosporales bacterium]